MRVPITEAIHGGEAHRRGHARAIADGAHRGAVAEVGDDHPAVRLVTEQCGKLTAHILVGEAVKP